ncbi:HAD-IC family P-type ATPase [Shinella kummerowiae]|jgi:magnesium-transporting ATPase (P-type)|uniref:HAD-IC family P-type ATPase n=1 Tax=Shinella kummerowiae TaxID=417745 RepID=A0A6N8SLP0_9HYPH|nr:HAD-IC family P-type ATPase [Shinella kummerowiae]MCT7668097.1 HAD-IC family P-type ATPase [Shinella kummerowiae]MXN49313.1 HAD-IC family P-type ATPase [Shinella kummerowiae]
MTATTAQERPQDVPVSGKADSPFGWHARTKEDTCTALGSGPDGLRHDEVARRLFVHGPNELPAAAHLHPFRRFLAQFNNALIYFLLSAALAATVLGHAVDGAVIAVVVLVNAVVGVLQEGKAERALDAIRDMIAPHAVVVRDGERHTVDAREIVPGDVVVLEAGDKVPADMRLLRARGLTADEAILTGESVPVEKRDEAVAADTALGERLPILHSGTLVATGQGHGVVVATGSRTEIGRISSLVGNVRTLTTPLLRQINEFGRLFTWCAIGMAALVFFFAVLARGYDWIDALMVVVALAVGVVPEGLPAVITITLAIGVRRMAARNAVVRHLPAVETLGATSVICSDKTGTLTKNEMTVRHVVTTGGATALAGSGYAPEGAFAATDGRAASSDPARDTLVRAALLCNDARLVERDGHWAVLGDPMEGALVTLAAKAGLHQETERTTWGRLDEIPFDARHRFMATLHVDPNGTRHIFVKGAPERVLEMCTDQACGGGTSAIDRAYWRERIDAAAAEGERVLGFATIAAGPDIGRLTFGMVETGLTFLGVAGFIDPPREEAVAAVAECRSAGIAVKMITGDHNGTAAAIARKLAIADDPKALDGSALDAMPDEELRRIVEEASVFARATPEHKLRIVRALQANGHIVAMTGDGVNDAPAVKQADVGIAMGRKGTEAAKEAAQMVLLDDNFASIVAAIREGRTVYDNIRKVITWELPTNGAETLCVIFAVVIGATLPMSPIQILWINMILTVTLGLVLAFEPSEPGVMRRPPRRRDAPILSRFLVWRIAFVSLVFMLGVFGIFEYALRRGYGEDGARTMVINMLVVMEIFYLFNVRYLHRTSFSLAGVMGTPAVLAAIAVVVAAQLLFTFAPFMHALFGTAPIALPDGLLILAVGVITMAVLECEKAVARKVWSGSGNGDGRSGLAEA